MYITLYNFSKKDNSTGIPFGSGTTVTAVLKDPTDILNPVFRLQASTFTGNNFNYVSALLMGKTRYYRIDKSTYETNDIILISCEEDICATWRAEILASTQYVLRSSDTALYKYANNYDRRLIVDDSVPTLAEPEFSAVYIDNAFTVKNGYYCIGFYGKIFDQTGPGGTSLYSHSERGPVTYVYMKSLQLEILISILNDIRSSDADKNPLQYFASCVYIPFELDTNEFYLFAGRLQVGTYAIPKTAPTPAQQEFIQYYLHRRDNENPTFDMIDMPITETVTLPHHMQLPTNDKKYLNYPPYYSCHVYAGPFGDFDLPIERLQAPTSFYNYDRKIKIQIMVDQATGYGRFYVGSQTDSNNVIMDPVFAIDAKIGVDVPLSQIVSNSLSGIFNIASNLVSAAGSLVTGNVFGVAQSIGAAVLSGYQNKIPRLDSKGSTGSMSALKYSDIRFLIEQEIITPLDLDQVGLPVMDIILLNTVTPGSLVVCKNAHIEIPGYKPEIEYIDDALESGLHLD